MTTTSPLPDGFLQVIFDLNPFPMWIYDRETLAFLRVNEAAQRTYGYSEQQFLGMTLLDIRPAEERERLRSYIGGLADSSKTRGFQQSGGWRHRKRDGEIIEIEAGNSPEFMYGGRPVVIAIIVDVTEKQRSLRALAESRAALAEAQELAGVRSWSIALGSGAPSFSGEVFDLLASSAETRDPLAVARALLLDPIPEEDASARDAVQRALAAGEPFDVEHRLFVGEDVRWCRTRSKVVADTSGAPAMMIGTVHDITRDKVAAQRLHELAYSDATTELPNRRALLEHVGEGAPGQTLMLIGFRQLTLAAQHNEGRNAMISRAVVQHLRASLPPHVLLTQYADDTFAVYGQLGRYARSGAQGVAAKILKRFERPLALQDGHEIVVAASIGFVLSMREAISAARMAARANAALGKALEQAGSVVQYSSELESELGRRDIIERNLRHAVTEQRLTPVYQPIVCLKTGEITGVEALMRWDCPGLGMVPPSEFIAIAEESDLITQLGEWMLREACAQNRRWQIAGFTGLRIAVNCSWKQIEKRDFVRLVKSVCDTTGLAPGHLAIELTETSLLRRERVGLQNLAALRRLGVSIALDDFGTGFSSLSYLGSLPLDVLKIDRAFVSSLGDDSFNAKVAASVVELAQYRGLEVVGEGVETLEQCETLRGLGCDKAQGYLLGRPVSAAALTDLLVLRQAQRVLAASGTVGSVEAGRADAR